MNRTRTFICLSMLLVVFVLLAPEIAASSQGLAMLGKGKQEAGVSAGYGWSFESPTHEEVVPLHLHWGYVLTGPLGSSWYRGNVEFIAGGSLYYFCDDTDQYAVGCAGLLRYNFLNSSRWVPFVQGGFGLMHSNLDSGDFPPDFNFSSQAGAGIRYFLSPSLSVHAVCQIVHFSNAGLKHNNPGFNLSEVLLGVSWHY